MEDFVPKEDSLIKNATHTSDKVQSIQVRKLIPQVEKLRRESFPISPLSLNGSLTNVDVCDTSFGKEVMEDMKTNNADIPDESFSEEIFLNDTKCQQKSANTTNADMPDASFSEEVLQDMDYGLDALRDAVPVLCLKKNEDSCDDADIFEEMSAFQVMGIFNNKDSKRTAKSINRKHEGKDNESKNKRSFPDKNIDSLYNNEENENPKSNDKLECTKHPGKKMDECDDVNDSMQDNEKDINNNDNECSMETTESGANEYDWVQKMMLTENYANQYNNCLGKETPEENCQMKEPDEDDKRKSTDQNYIKIKVKENIENASVVNSKDLKDNEVSIFCKKEGYKQPLDLPENVLDEDSCFNSNAPEGRPVQKEDASKEHKDKCIQSFRGTRRGELSDRSEITNLNDSMRQIVVDFIKQLPSSSENFLIRVEPITECPMCYLQFEYQDFIFSTTTGAYIADCKCGLTIYIIFEESLHLLKEYHSSSHSSDASSNSVCSSLTNVTSLDSEFEASSPVITEIEKKDSNELSDCQLNKRKNRTRFILFNESDDESLDCEDDSDDNYVP